jgi:tRNA(Ile)-lysidine synthase
VAGDVELGALSHADSDALFKPVIASPQPATWVLAVSGGADSMAMMHLAADWVRRHPQAGITLVVATVDHGLRLESAQEARSVGIVAAALSLPHVTLPWLGEKPSTGVQAAARMARYKLLQAYAESQQLQPAHILTAHTADDQAETLLMRLARGSGVDGLAAMRPERVLPGSRINHVRPLLNVPKVQLIATLQARGISWNEDPSNTNEKFERIRIRGLLPVLAEAGIDVSAMGLSARRLDRASAALDDLTGRLWDRCVDAHQGAFITIDRRPFDASPSELRVRLMIRAVTALGEASPSLAQIEDLVVALNAPAVPARTLSGAMVQASPDKISGFREPGRLGLPELELIPGESAAWDGRFRVELLPQATGPVVVRALTASEWSDLRTRFDIHPAQIPTRAAYTLPSFWRGSELIAVPWFGTLSHTLHAESQACRASGCPSPSA